jgi:hypothetical protein
MGSDHGSLGFPNPEITPSDVDAGFVVALLGSFLKADQVAIAISLMVSAYGLVGRNIVHREEQYKPEEQLALLEMPPVQAATSKPECRLTRQPAGWCMVNTTVADLRFLLILDTL